MRWGASPGPGLALGFQGKKSWLCGAEGLQGRSWRTGQGAQRAGGAGEAGVPLTAPPPQGLLLPQEALLEAQPLAPALLPVCHILSLGSHTPWREHSPLKLRVDDFPSLSSSSRRAKQLCWGAAEACRGQGASVEGGWIPPGRSKEGSVECPAGGCEGVGGDRGVPVEAGGEWIREGSTVLKSALQRLGAETLILSQGWPGGTCPHRKRPGVALN